MTSADEYAQFRDSRGCGHMTGTAASGPAICGRQPTHDVHRSCPFNVNDLACNIHANAAKRHLYAVFPAFKES
jgi:hypothetical protein